MTIQKTTIANDINYDTFNGCFMKKPRTLVTLVMKDPIECASHYLNFTTVIKTIQ